jgi:hypothetical protein
MINLMKQGFFSRFQAHDGSLTFSGFFWTMIFLMSAFFIPFACVI